MEENYLIRQETIDPAHIMLYEILWDEMIHQLNSSNKNKKNSWIFLVRGTFNNQLHTVVDPAPDLTQTMCLWQNFNKVLLHFVLF